MDKRQQLHQLKITFTELDKSQSMMVNFDPEVEERNEPLRSLIFGKKDSSGNFECDEIVNFGKRYLFVTSKLSAEDSENKKFIPSI